MRDEKVAGRRYRAACSGCRQKVPYAKRRAPFCGKIREVNKCRNTNRGFRGEKGGNNSFLRFHVVSFFKFMHVKVSVTCIATFFRPRSCVYAAFSRSIQFRTGATSSLPTSTES